MEEDITFNCQLEYDKSVDLLAMYESEGGKKTSSSSCILKDNFPESAIHHDANETHNSTSSTRTTDSTTQLQVVVSSAKTAVVKGTLGRNSWPDDTLAVRGICIIPGRIWAMSNSVHWCIVNDDFNTKVMSVMTFFVSNLLRKMMYGRNELHLSPIACLYTSKSFIKIPSISLTHPHLFFKLISPSLLLLYT